MSGSPGRDWSSSSAEPSGFKRYYQTIRHHLGLIAACIAVTLLAAVAYVQVAPRSYTAEAQLLINPASQQNTVLFSLPVLHMSGDPTTDVLTAASLVTTPQVANAVVHKLHLNSSPSALLAKVQSTPLAQSNIVAVQAQASSALQAQRIANAFATEVIAVRTAGLHQALALLIPGLRDQVAALPPAERGGVGTLGDELSQLQQLMLGNDPTISVAAPAVLPAGPTSPRKSLALAAGLFAGLLIGIGAAFGFDALDPRVQREEQVRELARGVPIVARIPRVGTRPKRRPLMPNELPPPAMEQYRMLRAALSMRSTGTSQAYLVAGSSPSEGKTTSALSLATVLARGGSEVILIEADLRRPTIANTVGIQGFAGTEQVLAGEVELSQALSDVTFGGAEFRLLAAHPNGSSAELLSYSSAQRLVDQAKQQAEFVVIDSPPLTAVIDALPLAMIADDLIVVVRIGHSRVNKVSDLFELLARHHRPPSGVVLVGTSETEADNYAYYTPERQESEPASELAAELSPPARARSRGT
ncbi:MAG: Wzz/FepE/Etk N-terminal domain-containing protein [Solirubrobacteraceae bacterium]